MGKNGIVDIYTYIVTRNIDLGGWTRWCQILALPHGDCSTFGKLPSYSKFVKGDLKEMCHCKHSTIHIHVYKCTCICRNMDSWWPSGQESACLCRRPSRRWYNPWVRKIPWRRKWQPIPVFLLENPMDRGAWWAVVHGVAEESHTAKGLNNSNVYEYIHDFLL